MHDAVGVEGRGNLKESSESSGSGSGAVAIAGTRCQLDRMCGPNSRC